LFHIQFSQCSNPRLEFNLQVPYEFLTELPV
jgi:hypothetical protein